MILTVRGKTDRGLVRANNEDNFHFDDKLGLLVVADGMGGHASGEIASQLAVNIIRDSFQGSPKPIGEPDPFCSPEANRLKGGIVLANRAVYEAAQSSPQFKGMGTTVVAVLLTGQSGEHRHTIGDVVSIWCAAAISNSSPTTTRRDGAGAQELISREEAAHSQIKNFQTKALGIAPDMEPD